MEQVERKWNLTRQAEVRPEWRDLYIDNPKETEGRILCAFELVPKVRTVAGVPGGWRAGEVGS